MNRSAVPPISADVTRKPVAIGVAKPAPGPQLLASEHDPVRPHVSNGNHSPTCRPLYDQVMG